MKILTRPVIVLLIALTGFFSNEAIGQSIINPADTVYTYNSAATLGTPTNPKQPATANTIGKWIRTVRMSWNTSSWKCYVYNGVPFRLRFPTSYNPNANDGKQYPMLVFFHGLGEAGPLTDNEYQLYHGGNVFENRVATGAFDGYVLCMQSTGSWGSTHNVYIKAIIDYMIANNKLSPFAISVNGLSAGGYNSWNFMEQFPSYTTSALPMSGISIQDQSYVSSYKYTPIWYFQGGLDGAPAQNTADQTTAVINQAGGNLRYTIYPNLGHGTWDRAWNETDFFPWISRVYMSNPWTLFGRTQFCPGDAINVTLGVAPGLTQYQWRKDGTIISGDTTNSISVTQTGTYDCRLLNGTVWSDWSHVPVVISLKPPTVTPAITNAPLVSNVIPAIDRASTILTEPAGYATYAWQKVGDSTNLSSTNTLTVSTPGSYIARVTEQFGCSSSFTAPYTVASASGPNKPDAASGLVASTLANSSLLLNWSQNPTPTYNETNFEIYQATKAGGPYKLVAVMGADVVRDTVTGLNSGTKYYFVIRAIDATAGSAISNEASATTVADVQAPTAPTNLTVTGTNRYSISLSWTASTDNVGVAGYDIYINGVRSYTVTNPATTTFTVYGLNQGQSYALTVKAKDQAGNVSPASNQVSAEPLLTGLPYKYYNLPGGLSALPNFTTLTPALTGIMQNVTLTGMQANNNFAFLWQGYIIIPTTGTYYFRTTSDDGSRLWLGSLNGTTSPYSYSGTPLINNDGGHGPVTVTSAAVNLTAGVYPIAIGYAQFTGGYTMSVAWKTPTSGGNFVPIPNAAFSDSAQNNGTAPAPPSNLVAMSSSYNAVALTWKDNSTNETGFEIWRSTSISSGFTTVGNTGAGVTFFTDNAVAANTKYYYQIRSINLYGQSAFASSYVEAEWKFNNNYADSSGNGHTLTAANSPTFDASNKAEGGYSVKLNGTNQNITIANTSSFLQEAYTQRTISCWIKPTVTTGTYQVIWDIGGSDNGLALMLNANTLVAAVASGNTSATISTAFTSTAWSHVAVVYNGDSLLLYVNGVLAASNTSLGFHTLSTTTNGARIGQVNGSLANNVSNSTLYGGWVDDFTIFNQALTTSAVNSVMALNTVGAVSSATTQVLPAIPAAPTGLSASVASASVINVTWTNTATNASNIQVYRSSNNNTNYILWATIAGNAVSFNDSALFSNAKYYYKVNAINPGGTSAYSNEGSATTLDVPPVITKLASRQVQYGSTTVIPLAATSVNSGVLNFSAVGSLPAFASLTDNGNGTGSLTLNPASSDQGNYTLSIKVADVFGGADTTTFNLAVNNNYAPTLDTILNVTINQNDTLSLSLSGHNVNPADTLTIAVSHAPNAYTLTQVSNGVATLFLHPTYAASGTFAVNVTVNDNNGLSATRTFNVTVNYKDPSTKTYVRMAAQDTITGVWNSVTGVNTSNLIDEKGVNTGAGLTFSPASWWSTYAGGPTTGNNSGVYPDAVMLDYYYFGIFGGPDTVTTTVTGLDTSRLYNLTFYASSTWGGTSDNGTTVYSAGGKVVQLYVQNNRTNTVTISSIKPNADGTIPFRMWKLNANTPVGYLNALVITKQYDDGLPPAAPISLVGQNAPGQGVSLSWQDVAYNETAYQVYRSTSAAGPYAVIGTVGAKVQSFIDSTVSGGIQYYYKLTASNSHGVSDSTPVVSVLTTDRIPKINPIADITLNNTQTATVNVTAVDDATDHITLTATGLPSFVTFTDNGNGTGVINVQPGAGSNGVYNGVTITATDLSDSSRSAVFNIFVVEKNVSSTYINFTDTTLAPRPWNNISGIPFAGVKASNLIDDGGVNTGVSVTIQDGFDGVVAHGMRARNNTGVYPESVTSTGYFCFASGARRLLISGLNPAKAYNFVLFNSYYDGTPNLTNFTLNGVTMSSRASYNTNRTVEFNGITPDASGNVTISVAKDASATFSVITSLVIQAYDPAVVTLMAPADLRVINTTKTAVNLQWQDRASNETGYEVWRSTNGTSYSLLTTLAANSTSYVDQNLSSNGYYYYTVRAVNSGVYSTYTNTVTGYTYATLVDIAFNSATTPQASAPWNNTAAVPQIGYVWNNFANDAGLLTNVGMLETGAWAGIYAGAGVNTGNNSGVYPDAVMANAYVLFPGQSGSVQVTGLNLSQTYDFTFFSSVTGTSDASSIYTVNGKTVILNATLNSTGTMTIYGLTPDANGNIFVQVDPYTTVSQFGELGALVIKGYTASTVTAPPAPSVVTATANTATANTFSLDNASANRDGLKALAAYPNPFGQSFTLSVPASDNDQVVVSLSDITGKLLYEKRFEGLYRGNNLLSIQPGNSLTKGVYFVSVTYVNKNERKTLKVVKD